MPQVSRKVLIVEDDALIALDLESHLQRLGHDVMAIASSGVEAIQMVKEARPDLVLMDIRIKGAMDGIQAAEHIHKRFDVPVVYVTAHTDRDTLERAKQTEPFGFIAKPVTQGSLGAAVEIAVHKHAAANEVRQREAWLATTLNSVGHAMIVTDAQGQVRFLNQAAERLTGLDGTEAVGQDVRKALTLLNRRGIPLSTDLVRLCILRGTAVPLPPDLRVRSAQGQEHDIEGRIAASMQGGVPVGAVLTFNDVSERNRNETQRKRAEVARAVARLAGATSKDLNDLVTVIINISQRLQRSLSRSDRVQSLVEELARVSQSAAQVTKRLTQLSREVVTLPSAVNLNALLEDASADLMRSVPSEIQLSVYPQPGIPSTFADPGQIRELVMTLVSYAASAMPQGGRIDLETGTETGTLAADRFVRLIVRYDGPYMDQEKLEQLFGLTVPPFGARSQRVDLFVVLAILADIGGHISANSVRDGKNSFYVLLPEAAPTEMPAFLEEVNEEPSPTAILLVEADAELRQAMCEGLTQAGYRCLQAADEADALFLAKLYDGPLQVLVAAQPPGGLSGDWPLLQILRERAETRILLTLGNPGTRTLLDPAMAGRAAFLKAPFPERQLREAIEELLDGRSVPRHA